MKTIARYLTFATVVLLLVATATGAKGRGGTRGGSGGGNGAAGATLQRGSGGPHGQQAGGRGAGAASRDRQRLHVTDQARGQYQDCAGAGDRVRQQSRELAKAARGSNFSAAEARRQRDQLGQGAGNLFREHDRLMSQLGENTRAAVQDRTRTLDRDRDRIHAHLQAMDRELGRGNPDANSVRSEARKLNQATKTWQRHYRQLGNDLGATDG